ncbi:MAG: hypothetical protein WCI87_06280, partial [Euryarchaeota archaeon]
KFWWQGEIGYSQASLTLYDNGVLKASMSHNINWTQQIVTLAAGTHTLEWRYYQTGSSGGGFEGRLDKVEWLPAPAPPAATTFLIATSTTSPTTNVPFTLSGTLKSGTAALTSKPVHLERRTGTTGTWANVANTFKYTNAYGKVAVSQTRSTAGTYQYRWHYNGTATYLPAYSAAVTETVKKPTTFTIATSPTAPKLNVAFTV